MPFSDLFYESILPGNYALTKSYELTKVETTGTLWYTKKFLVLYYFVFLSNDIFTREYITKVTKAFDTYIADLDESVREDANNFFYPNNEAINFKSENFIVFSDFAGNEQFETQEERKQHFENAKKYYFSILMGSGGQRGVKKLLKEAVQQKHFTYSEACLNEAILDAVIRVCIEEGNTMHDFIDKSIKHVISKGAQSEIIRASNELNLTYDIVLEIVNRLPHQRPNYKSIKNDLIGFIRNERQVLYYYGYFHSKSSGATDFEFSSLTPIGEIGLSANSREFLCLWEHQKLKMISQPVTVAIENINGLDVDYEKFAISYTPYTDILNHLAEFNNMTLKQYRYIVSRKKSYLEDCEWNDNIETLLKNIDDIRKKVAECGRNADKNDEDGRKELLKYLIGIRSDISMDNSKNILGICRWKKSSVEISDNNKLTKVLNIYRKLCDYKKQKYGELFCECESELKRLYTAKKQEEDTQLDSRIKINWDLYNIRPDKAIILGVMKAAISIETGSEEYATIADFAYENYRNLLGKMGLRSALATKKAFKEIVFALSHSDYSIYLREVTEDKSETRTAYLNTSTEDLFLRLQSESQSATTEFVENRERNTTLISLLKTYYIKRFLNNNLLKCECCGEETFVTAKGEPYVEFHHLIPFGGRNDGPDHYLNLFALCPNCHRQIHFLSIQNKTSKYQNLSVNNYLQLTFVERLRNLKEKLLLKSYQLEFLLADNAITQQEYDSIVA